METYQWAGWVTFYKFMELLRTIKEGEIYPGLDSKNEKENKYRKAVRGVVLDDEDKVGLIFVARHNYYKLPGGGAEGSESDEDALKRECLEEIGCNVKVMQEIGKVFEHRDKINLDQESFCYLAKVVGEKGKTNLVDYEITDRFETVWVDIGKAIELVKTSKPGLDTYDGPFIIIRDEIFINKAKEILK